MRRAVVRGILPVFPSPRPPPCASISIPTRLGDLPAMKRTLLPLLLAVLPLSAAAPPRVAAPATGKIDFTRDVRPILVDRCFAVPRAGRQGAQGGPAPRRPRRGPEDPALRQRRHRRRATPTRANSSPA